LVNCSNTTPAIVKENDEYWAVTNGYEDYANFYKVDNNIRYDFIPNMLSGDYMEYFNYESKYYDIDEHNYLKVSSAR
jgi:hypothetical protein